MKKVFKISLLSRFLLVLGLIITLLLCVQINHAYSTQIKYSANNIPIKRPLNLFKFEESADTIFNLVQKVGAKPVTNIQTTKLKKNENLSSALKRINFGNFHINKIINAIMNIILVFIKNLIVTTFLCKLSSMLIETYFRIKVNFYR